MAGPHSPSKTEQRSPSGQLVVALVASTMIGIGGGALLGWILGGDAAAPGAPIPAKAAPGATAVEPVPDKAGKANGAHAAETAGKDAWNANLRLKELPPIVTNLASPETGWVRLQAAIVYDTQALPHPDIVVSEVMADVVTFLRTLTLASVQGADGLRRLHEDLTERAVIRSEGRIREFIIEALVVQ